MENKTNLQNDARNISIFKLAWPIFIQMILSMTLGYIDTIMISHYSQTAVGAIGNANQIMGFLRLAFSIITSATGVIVAQYIGAKQTEKMNQIYTVSVLFNLVLSVAVCFIITTFSKPLLTAIQIPSIMMEDANAYMKIVGFFLFTDAIVMIFSQVFNCHGKTSVGMFIFFGMNVVNIIANYTFLYGPLAHLNLGVKGVAISTSLSSTLGMIISYILFRKIIKGKLSFKLLKPFPKELLSKLIKLGIPTAGENISYNIAQIIITAFVNTMGPEAINAKIFCNMLTLFSLIYSNAMAGATSIIVGQSVGANDYDFAYKRVMKSLSSAMIVSIIVSIVNFAISKWTLGFFTPNQAIIEIGKKVMFVGIFLEIGRCINLIVIRSMRSAGDVVFPTVLGIGSMWGISVVFTWILGIFFHLGIVGAWIAMAADEIFRGIVVFIRWIVGSWRGKSVVEKDTENQ